MIQAGTTLQQRYKIDKQIGQGGMGAVYVATDERFGSTVAIKETLCMDDNFRKAIEREARLLNSLKHSALPRVSDHFEEDNGLFLVMEYIPGDDVASILERDQRAFPVDKVVSWADDLLEALDYLHNQDIPVIHRDIKPQNLKVTPRGQIILLDFGLAKGNPTDAGHNTAAKSIFGYSRNYASLEQIQGTGTDPRSDLYSLAATLYHLLTNVAPEDALTRAMSVLSQKPDPLVPANAVNPAIPAGVAGVLQKALDLNASERPASASEMRQMLRESEKYAYLADATFSADAPTSAHVFAHPTRIMADTTHADAVRQFDVKTEVMPVGLSQMTSVRGPQTDAPQRKGSGLAVAAGAFSVLLVGAAIAGGIYVVRPSVFGVGNDSNINSNTEPLATVPVAADSNTAVANSNASNVLAGSNQSQPQSVAPSTSETVRPGDTTDRPVDATKTDKAAVEDKPTTKIELGDGMTVEMDDLEDPKNVTITTKNPDGTVKTMKVDPSLQPNMQRPPPPGFDPFPRGIDPSKMTPEQRRKFQQLMRQRGRLPIPMPQPQRTPPQ
jgi:serine/threonine protein kinase